MNIVTESSHKRVSLSTVTQPDVELDRARHSGIEDVSNRRPSPQVLLSFLCIVAAVFALQYAEPVLIPVVLFLLIFYALDPIVTWFSRFRIPRVLTAGVLLLVLVGGFGVAVYGLRAQAAEVLEKLPEAAQKVRKTLASRPTTEPGTMARVQIAAGEIEKTAAEAAGQAQPTPGVTRVQIEEPVFRASDYLWSGSRNILWLAGQGITIFFLVLFLLAAGYFYKRKLVAEVGPGLGRKRITVEILNEIDRQIGRFLLVQVFTSLLIGTVIGFALWGLCVNQPVVWGVAAGVLNSIPYFGTIIVTVALALAAFLQFGSLSMVGAVAGITLLVTSLDGFLLTPFLTGRLSKINHVAIFISLLFWGWLWGAIGMLLAVAMMMVIKSVCDRVESLQPMGPLLSDSK